MVIIILTDWQQLSRTKEEEGQSAGSAAGQNTQRCPGRSTLEIREDIEGGEGGGRGLRIGDTEWGRG